MGGRGVGEHNMRSLSMTLPIGILLPSFSLCCAGVVCMAEQQTKLWWSYQMVHGLEGNAGQGSARRTECETWVESVWQRLADPYIWTSHDVWGPGYHCSAQWWSLVRDSNVGPSPLRPPRVHQTSFTWQVFPGLPRFSQLFCFHVLAPQRRKNGRGLGTKLDVILSSSNATIGISDCKISKQWISLSLCLPPFRPL